MKNGLQRPQVTLLEAIYHKALSTLSWATKDIFFCVWCAAVQMWTSNSCVTQLSYMHAVIVCITLRLWTGSRIDSFYVHMTEYSQSKSILRNDSTSDSAVSSCFATLHLAGYSVPNPYKSIQYVLHMNHHVVVFFLAVNVQKYQHTSYFNITSYQGNARYLLSVYFILSLPQCEYTTY